MERKRINFVPMPIIDKNLQILYTMKINLETNTNFTTMPIIINNTDTM